MQSFGTKNILGIIVSFSERIADKILTKPKPTSLNEKVLQMFLGDSNRA
jgi:hypothetical protein